MSLAGGFKNQVCVTRPTKVCVTRPTRPLSPDLSIPTCATIAKEYNERQDYNNSETAIFFTHKFY